MQNPGRNAGVFVWAQRGMALSSPQFLQFQFMRETQLSGMAVDLNRRTQGECA
jgi:hypothetical protein